VACGSDTAGKVRGVEGRGSAPGMVQCRGTGRCGTVVGVCLVPEGGIMPREGGEIE